MGIKVIRKISKIERKRCRRKTSRKRCKENIKEDIEGKQGRNKTGTRKEKENMRTEKSRVRISNRRKTKN